MTAPVSRKAGMSFSGTHRCIKPLKPDVCLLALWSSRYLTFSLVFNCVVRSHLKFSKRTTTVRWQLMSLPITYVRDSLEASGKIVAQVDTVASAFCLSLLFGMDKVLVSRDLDTDWKDLQAKLASGYPVFW